MVKGTREKTHKHIIKSEKTSCGKKTGERKGSTEKHDHVEATSDRSK